MKAVIACGGTGGHLFPGLAVGEVLVQRGWEVLVIISEKEIDALAIQGRKEFQFEKVQSIGMPAVLSPGIFAFSVRFLRSIAHCRRMFSKFKPDIVLGMGGFTSTPPIMAGKLKGIPTFVHESNAIPGKANKLTAHFASSVLLGLADCATYFPGKKTEVTGTPIRAGLKKKVDRAAVYAQLGLDAAKKTILIMGGSQGARGINHAILQALPFFVDQPIQLVHLTGPNGEVEVRTQFEKSGVSGYIAPFYHQMEELYAIADFAVARSGAASLSELSYFGIPSILIPYPYAAEDHQTFNARIFEQAGAAVLLKESDATGETLSKMILEFLNDPDKKASMSKQSRLLSPEDAASRVADTLERSLIK